MSVAKIGKRGVLIMSAEIRKKTGLKEGDDVLIDVDEKGIIHILKRPTNFSEALRNLYPEVWENVDPVEYVKEERGAGFMGKIAGLIGDESLIMSFMFAFVTHISQHAL